MEMVTLGKTGITVNKNGFGALPIQRISTDDAVALARRAYEAGMTFFDTARFYTDSEEKLGEAFDGMREKVCIATKTAAQNAEDFWKDLEVSLHNLRTDYIDIYQFHNPSFCPKPGDGTGLYEAMLEAKAQGKIRLGESGNALVYGGSRCGLMGEIAESTLNAGGKVTGVEPEFFVQGEANRSEHAIAV